MKLVIVILLVIFITSLSQFEEVFLDDFNGNSLDTSQWSILDFSTDYDPRNLQLYMRDNVEVRNGHLIITTRRETTLGPDNKLYNFTSGSISGKNLLSYYQGKFIVRAKLPPLSATGAWPAYKLLPQSHQCWPTGGEIDIMEATCGHKKGYHVIGSYKKGTQCGATHEFSPGASYPPVGSPGIDWSKDFHEFSVEWGEGYMVYSVDDIVYHTVLASEVHFPNAPMYFVLNTAVAWYMPPGEYASYPATHVIDWVKVVQFIE